MDLLKSILEIQDMDSHEFNRLSRLVELESIRRASLMRIQLELASKEYARTQAPVLSYPISDLITEQEYNEGIANPELEFIS